MSLTPYCVFGGHCGHGCTEYDIANNRRKLMPLHVNKCSVALLPPLAVIAFCRFCVAHHTWWRHGPSTHWFKHCNHYLLVSCKSNFKNTCTKNVNQLMITNVCDHWQDTCLVGATLCELARWVRAPGCEVGKMQNEWNKLDTGLATNMLYILLLIWCVGRGTDATSSRYHCNCTADIRTDRCDIACATPVYL